MLLPPRRANCAPRSRVATDTEETPAPPRDHARELASTFDLRRTAVATVAALVPVPLASSVRHSRVSSRRPRSIAPRLRSFCRTGSTRRATAWRRSDPPSDRLPLRTGQGAPRAGPLFRSLPILDRHRRGRARGAPGRSLGALRRSVHFTHVSGERPRRLGSEPRGIELHALVPPSTAIAAPFTSRLCGRHRVRIIAPMPSGSTSRPLAFMAAIASRDCSSLRPVLSDTRAID